MKPSMPLRRRFTLLATVMGLLLSTLSAATIAFVAEDYEYVIATEIMHGQAEDYGLRLANGLPAELPRTQRLSGYRIDAQELPRAYTTYAPGVREDPAHEDIHVGVFDTAAGRLVFTIDLGDIEALEKHLHVFVAAMIVLGTLLAGWMGWLFSGLALTPLRRLAEGVDALPVQPQPSTLAAGTSNDELGRLAGAIDAYQARLLAADAREQAFFADASHELRTPLTVVQGVTDVLLDDPPGNPAQAARLQRLERGVRDMRHLLDAMLSAARRTPLQAEAIPAGELLSEASAIALAGKPGIASSIDASGDLHAPRREALLLVAGLARRLAQPHSVGELRLQLHEDRIDLRFIAANDTLASPATHARADTASGSALLDRLAARLGWRVAFDSPASIAIRLC
ncbi:MAG TPA: HAMP domain-containing sensor histidine kinase [Thermomonas sp.]|jgi:signal transduction histidine kinase|uniref:sensor histidine kinase n=1 Tax=Thermomonas sp. TaxID=1971895 RepID=UPI002C3DFA77|nr:HAMP domain-containing sensor histidine kinase [Thermomonas sp.]HOZ23166.1 HAMP domain-containing sensor histidine kinase [Thermomonas sp.]